MEPVKIFEELLSPRNGFVVAISGKTGSGKTKLAVRILFNEMNRGEEGAAYLPECVPDSSALKMNKSSSLA
jgi:KaiC/GvpD/RAD55 family RecA-like ATPase